MAMVQIPTCPPHITRHACQTNFHYKTLWTSSLDYVNEEDGMGGQELGLSQHTSTKWAGGVLNTYRKWWGKDWGACCMLDKT